MTVTASSPARRRAHRAEPVRPVARDEREVRQRLDVLHQRRPAVQTSLGQPRRDRVGHWPTAAPASSRRRSPRLPRTRRQPRPRGVDVRPAARRRLLDDVATARMAATTTSPAPAIPAARTAPSSTRCGSVASSTLSLALAGSPSVPLTTTTGRPGAAATAASLRAVGKAAPPRPVSPARPTSAIRSRWRIRQRCHAGLGAGPGSPAGPSRNWREQPRQAAGGACWSPARFTAGQSLGSRSSVRRPPCGCQLARRWRHVRVAAAEQPCDDGSRRPSAADPHSISATHQMCRSPPAVSECKNATGHAR